MASRTASAVMAIAVGGWSSAARSMSRWKTSCSSSRAASSPAWALGSPALRSALTWATTLRATGRLAARRVVGRVGVGAGAVAATSSNRKRSRAVRERGSARIGQVSHFRARLRARAWATRRVGRARGGRAAGTAAGYALAGSWAATRSIARRSSSRPAGSNS